MARKIKFGLEMSDGTKVRGSIDELRAHFDLESIMGHFLSGKLIEWLEDRYYDEEADKIKAIDKNSPNMHEQLCQALGVEYQPTEKLDVSQVQEKNDKKAVLRQTVTDENILAHEERMAFKQEDLDRLMQEGTPEIYLCDSVFTITIKSENNPKYIGVGKARANILCSEGVYAPQNVADVLLVRKLGISFSNIQLDASDGWGQDVIGSLYYSGVNVERNYSEAVKWFRKSAEQGNPAGEHSLAVCYDSGKGVEKNVDEAVKWAQKSAAQDFIGGKVSLGALYYDGHGVEKNYEKALDLFKQGVKQCVPSAENRLGFCYYEGKCVEKNYEEAFKWFRKAAQNGYDYGCLNVGVAYYSEYGVDRDYGEAIKWYHKAIELGNIEAIRCLGDCYYSGFGVEQDCKEAVKLYRKAADNGDIVAKVSLGNCCYWGAGVEQNYDEAVKLYREASEEGNSQAKFRMGCCYVQGHGVKKDSKKGEAIFEKLSEEALKNNDLRILYDIEEFYESIGHGNKLKYLELLSEQGCEKSLKKLRSIVPTTAQEIACRVQQKRALEKAETGDAEEQYKYAVTYCRDNTGEFVTWLTKSAEQGYAAAQTKLGEHYERIDDSKYIYWIELAAKQDYLPALDDIYRYWQKKDNAKAEKWCERLVEIGDSEYPEASLDLKYIRKDIKEEREKRQALNVNAATDKRENRYTLNEDTDDAPNLSEIPSPWIGGGSSKKSGCFITTAVCGSLHKPDNCYELTMFRHFRDAWLCSTVDGQKLVDEYYRIAPLIVRSIDSRKDAGDIYSGIWKKYLQPCLLHLEKKNFQKCKEKYVCMVKNLEEKYLGGSL